MVLGVHLHAVGFYFVFLPLVFGFFGAFWGLFVTSSSSVAAVSVVAAWFLRLLEN